MGFGVGCYANCCPGEFWFGVGSTSHRGIAWHRQPRPETADQQWTSIRDESWRRYQSGWPCWPSVCGDPFLGWEQSNRPIVGTRPSIGNEDSLYYCNPSRLFDQANLVLKGKPGQLVTNAYQSGIALVSGASTGGRTPPQQDFAWRIFYSDVIKYGGGITWIDPVFPHTTRPRPYSDPYFWIGADVCTAYWALIFDVPEGMSLRSKWGFESIDLKIKHSSKSLLNDPQLEDLRDIITYSEWQDGSWASTQIKEIKLEPVDIVVGSCAGVFHEWDGVLRGAPPWLSENWMTKHVLEGQYRIIRSVTPDGSGDTLITIDASALSEPVNITDPIERRDGLPYGTTWFLAIVPSSGCYQTNPIPGDITIPAIGSGYVNQLWSNSVSMAQVHYARGFGSRGPVDFVLDEDQQHGPNRNDSASGGFGSHPLCLPADYYFQ